ARTSAGGLKCWGLNAHGQVGDGTTSNRLVPIDVPAATSNVTRIDVGGQHSCLGLASGLTKCWGANQSGQLGDGTFVDLYGPFFPDPPRNVVAVAGNTKATVSWTAPVYDGGFPLTTYTVTSAPSGIAVPVGATHLIATIRGLPNTRS